MLGDSLAELKIKIDADTKGMEKGLKSAESSMGKFSKGIQKHSKKIGVSMAAMGGAIVGAAAVSVKSWAKMGDEVGKMSKKIGFSTESLSEWRYVAELGGTSLEGIEKGVKRMSTSIGDLNAGLETQVREFDKLGITIEDLQGLAPEQQFEKIAFAIAGLTDDTEKMNVAQKIFGKSGIDLLPIFQQTTAAIEEQRKKAHELNIVFDEESAASAESLTDSFATIEAAMDGVKNKIAEALAPEIEELATKLGDVVIKVGEWVAENPKLVSTILKVGVALIGAGGLLIALNQIITAFRGLAIAMAVVHAFMGPAGWAKLAIGMAAAGAAIFGINKMIATPGGSSGGVTFSGEGMLPQMASGGIVTSPTVAMIGEAGPEAIVPLRGGMMGGSVVVNVAGSVMSERDLTSVIREELLKIKGRNTSTGL